MSPPQNDFTTTLPNNIRFPKAQFANSNFLPHEAQGALAHTPSWGAAKARLGLGAEMRGSEQCENLTLPANLEWKAGRHDWRCQKVVTFLVFLDSLSIHEKCQPVSQTWCLQNFSATLKWTA